MSFLQIASWNIEHLGGSSRASRKQSAFALADHIEMSGIHLIALQEIYVTPDDEVVRLGDGQPPVPRATPAGERRNADLDVVCYLLEEHLETPWSYRILPNRAAGDKSQLCALMWDTARLTLDTVQALAVPGNIDGDAVWDRKPHVVSFTTDILVWRRPAGGDWVETAETRRISVVPLHMKSNYGGVTRNRHVRAKEAVALCDALAALQPPPDPSLILIGDTNILDNAEPAIETFIARGFVDLNNNDSATYWSPQYAEAPFDRAFVAKDRPEFRYTRQYVMRSSDLTAHDRFLSDHYMIKISVKDYVDDEDPR
jgi:endonuclease/exonuclease/phosphatase family metal-dependent hydrolase